jgi:hypothetical protein
MALPPRHSCSPFDARVLLAGALALSVLASPRARADPLHLTVEAGTEFPLDVGARVTFELPGRLQLTGAIGFMPSGYTQLINDTLVDFNAYDQATANLIQSSLQNTLLLHLRLGWQPFDRHGFYFQAGYMVGFLGGGASGASVLAAGGHGGLIGSGAASDSFDISTTVQGITFEIGWVWLIEDRWQLRAGLGGMHTFASSSTITKRGGHETADDKTLENGAAAYIDNVMTTYVYSPMITFTAGFRIF